MITKKGGEGGGGSKHDSNSKTAPKKTYHKDTAHFYQPKQMVLIISVPGSNVFLTVVWCT